MNPFWLLEDWFWYTPDSPYDPEEELEADDDEL